jgi:hypothetical protein
MPGQRKAGKKKIGVWVTDEEQAQLTAALAQLGFDNLADYIRHVASLATEGRSPTSKKRGAKGKE